MKNCDIFLIFAQNIDCGYSLEPPRRCGSNEYPQSMFLTRNKKNNVYPCKPQFYSIKVGFKGVRIRVFVMIQSTLHQAPNTKGKDKQIQLSSHKMNRRQSRVGNSFPKIYVRPRLRIKGFLALTILKLPVVCSFGLV